jgi:hypothetical protein
MAERSINIFRDPYLAIYRPNKKTYSIVQWVDQGRYWKRTLVDYDLIATTTLRTQLIPLGNCEINIYPNNTNQAILVNCVASGQYLRYGNFDVAIIQKKPNSRASFRANIFMCEFPCTTVTQETQETPGTLPLWTIGDPNRIYTHISSITIKPQPLPTRIAWIIAEDASKKGETCPISLDAISPITASVTSCYHVFDSNALATWLRTKNTCPMCKQKTVATVAYDGLKEVPKDEDTGEDTSEGASEDDRALRLAAQVTYPDIVQYT